MADLYYYGSDVEQFTFFRIPKKLIQDKRFRALSSDSKILYGILMDRMTLSMKNNWFDENGRVYIIYKVAEITEELGCSERKAMMLLSELDAIGLIERHRQGLGRPNLIYVKNFTRLLEDQIQIPENEMEDHKNKTASEQAGIVTYFEQTQESEEKKERIADEGEVQPFQTCKNLQIKSCKNVQDQTCNNLQVKSCKNVQDQTCKNLQVINDTEYNENNNINNLSINHLDSKEDQALDGWKDRMLVLHTLQKKLGYDILIQDCPHQQKRIQELFDLMADVCCYAGETQQIGANIIQTSEFRHRFFQQLTIEHLRYVLQNLEQNTSKIRNIRSYLLICLYNAPVTMSHFYQQKVQNDWA